MKAGLVRIEVIRAWPHRHESRTLDMPAGATVGEAIAASGLGTEGVAGVAVFGERVESARVLQDGDRVELLGPLLADPKEARRRRAQSTDAASKPRNPGRT
jgi:putative ubiquitin-RnfH superfamily antitoxin RatB of RatAB toxin-antitoxin module